jgi:hypothetical protein
VWVSEPFNPFVEWLGMPAGAPGNYYALLQLPTFENDPALISLAAQRLKAHLLSIDPGSHTAEHQAILQQVYTAEQWLLDPASKAQYDAVLSGGSVAMAAAPPPSPAPPMPAPPPSIAPPPVWRNESVGTDSPFSEAPIVPMRLATRLRGKKRRNPTVLLFASFVILGGLAVAGGIIYKQGRLPDWLQQFASELTSDDKSVADARDSASRKEQSKAGSAEPASAPAAPTEETSPFEAATKQAESLSPEEKRERERQNLFKDSLRQAYLAMADRKLPEVDGHLKAAREKILNDDERNQVVRAENVQNSLAEFWRLIDQQIKTIKASDELSVAGTQVVVVKVDDQSLTIKAEGESHHYSIDALPAWAIKAIAEKTLAKDPPTKALYATFLAVHPKGDRALANRLFTEVARSGQDIRDIRPDPEFLPSAP